MAHAENLIWISDVVKSYSRDYTLQEASVGPVFILFRAIYLKMSSATFSENLTCTVSVPKVDSDIDIFRNSNPKHIFLPFSGGHTEGFVEKCYYKLRMTAADDIFFGANWPSHPWRV